MITLKQTKNYFTWEYISKQLKKMWKSQGFYITLWSILISLLLFYIIYKGYDDLRFYFDFGKSEAIKFFFQLIGALLVLFGLLLTLRRTEALEKQVKIAEDSNVTDRFQKAIEHLASGDESIRLGGILTLGRIAEESIERNPNDFKLVIDILSTCMQKISTKNTSVLSLDERQVIEYLLYPKNTINKERIRRELYIKIYSASENFIYFKNYTYDYFEFSNCSFYFYHMLGYNNCIFNDCNFNMKDDTFKMIHIRDSQLYRCKLQKFTKLSNIDILKSKLYQVTFYNCYSPFIRECNIMHSNFKDCEFGQLLNNSILYNVNFINCLNLNDQILLSAKKIDGITGIPDKQIERLKNQNPLLFKS